MNGLAGRNKKTSENTEITNNNEKYTKKYLEARRVELQDIFNNIKADLSELSDYFCPNSVRFVVFDIYNPCANRLKICALFVKGGLLIITSHDSGS